MYPPLRKLLIAGCVLRIIRALLMTTFVGVSQAANQYLLSTTFKASADLGLVMLLVSILAIFSGIASENYQYPFNIYTLVLEVIILSAVIPTSILCALSISPALHMSHLIVFFQLPYRLVCAGTGLAFAMVVLSIGIAVVSLLSLIFSLKLRTKQEKPGTDDGKDTAANTVPKSQGDTTNSIRPAPIAVASAGGKKDTPKIICCNMNCCKNKVIGLNNHTSSSVEDGSTDTATGSGGANTSSNRTDTLSTGSDGLFFSFRNSIRESLLLRLNNVNCTAPSTRSPVVPKRGAVRTPVFDSNGSQEFPSNSSRYL